MKRRVSAPLLPLGPNAVNVLLGGWAAPTVENDADPFEVFELDLAATWREHRAELTAEAQRRGITEIWAAQFDEVTP